MVDYSRNKTKKIPGYYVSVFENISDLTKFLQKPRKPGRSSSSESTSNGSWAGTRTYEEAFDKLKDILLEITAVHQLSRSMNSTLQCPLR